MLISPNLPLSELNPSQPLPLGIMASGSGTNFEAIALAIASGQLNAEIQVLIYNNPQAKVRSLGQKHGIPTVLLNHRDYKTREDLDRAIVTTLQQYGAEWVVMAGWMRVVTQVLIASFPERIINIHPSLLPSFKGIRAVERALAAKVKITGCTAHLVTLEIDSGKILIQAAVPVDEEDTPETLHARIQEQEHRILPRAIALAALNQVNPIENLTN
ncbi:phosphoribosylglycinamide formyltransferase [Myxosarcina sp. GI1(2024)]